MRLNAYVRCLGVNRDRNGHPVPSAKDREDAGAVLRDGLERPGERFDPPAGIAAERDRADLLPMLGCRTIALLGNHAPRHCGIATFTTDLTSAVCAERETIECLVVAMNDTGRRHAYPDRVRFEIAEADLASYRRAADFLNVSGVDVVCLDR